MRSCIVYFGIIQVLTFMGLPTTFDKILLVALFSSADSLITTLRMTATLHEIGRRYFKRPPFTTVGTQVVVNNGYFCTIVDINYLGEIQILSLANCLGLLQKINCTLVNRFHVYSIHLDWYKYNEGDHNPIQAHTPIDESFPFQSCFHPIFQDTFL